MNRWKKTNVLLVYEQFIASVRLCGYEQLRYLEEKGVIRFQCGLDVKITAKQCQWADIIVFVRSAAWLDYKIALENKKRGKIIVYVLDDDLLHIPVHYASCGYFRQAPVRRRILWFLKNSDVFASPSIYLLEKYIGYAGRTVRIEEPCIKHGMAAEKLYCQKQREQKQEIGEQKAAGRKGWANRKLKIGFAGSMDRGSEVTQILQGALVQFYRRHKNEIELEFMGAKPAFAERLGLACYPYEENYTAYQKKMLRLEWDIGLAPMPDTNFHRAKHYNKYIEYASIGCVGIYSNVMPYTQVIRNEENGILCENTVQGWIGALEWCLHHPSECAKMRENLALDMERFSLSAVSRQFAAQMPELSSYQAGRGRACAVRGYRMVGMLIRGMEFLFRYKSRVPQRLAEKIRECKKGVKTGKGRLKGQKNGRDE